jgi:cytochrome c peroxidase
MLHWSSHAGELLSPKQQLGSILYRDFNLSLNRNQSCASCHSLSVEKVRTIGRKLAPGFVDPDNVRKGTAVSDGSPDGATGTLNAPSIGYAAFSPLFHWDDEEELFVGGQFWNGRAADLSEQAKGPFLNPVEMAMPDKAGVIDRLAENPEYIAMFSDVFGIDIADPAKTEDSYDKMAEAIAAFEKTRKFNRFNSKYDYYLAGVIKLRPIERKGMDLFNGKAQCSACHVSDAQKSADGKIIFPPLFTDFTYDNIGLPRNVNIPGNPEPNLGLGGRTDIAEPEPEKGKHKVMSLRNIAITPPYGHNGVLKTLKQVVHFYNTRDTLGSAVDNNDRKFARRGWPAPEVPENVNRDELGNLGLTPSEERAILAFLKTLTDDYPEWGRNPRVPRGTPSPFAEIALPE